MNFLTCFSAAQLIAHEGLCLNTTETSSSRIRASFGELSSDTSGCCSGFPRHSGHESFPFHSLAPSSWVRACNWHAVGCIFVW